jgi:hypothetical protein
MIVVADTSAISNLLSIGRERILHALFGEVLVPPAVARELLEWHQELPAFVTVLSPGNSTVLVSLSSVLDPGETEAIALAVKMGADLLLIDERKGRAEAIRLGLKTTGLLGVLLEAKKTGLLDHLATVLDQLVTVADFRVSAAVRLEFLRLAGER